MELFKLISKEAILNEKLPLDIQTEDGMFEYDEIEKFMVKSNFTIDKLAEAFELNRLGKLADYLFDKNNKKVVAYQKVGLRYISEVIFAYKEYNRHAFRIEPLALPEGPKMTPEESYATLKGFIIEKFKKGETDYFKLATYLLDDFYELERSNIEIDIEEQKQLVLEAGNWLNVQKTALKQKEGYLLSEIVSQEIDKRDAYSLAKRYVLARMIIDNYQMDNIEIPNK